MKPVPLIIGLTLDVAGSFAIGLSYFAALFAWALVAGTAADVMPAGSWGAEVFEHAGLLATVLGGYIAGRVAAMRQVRHGAAVGLLSFFFWTSIELTAGFEQQTAHEVMLGLVLSVGAGALGGWLCPVPTNSSAPGGGLRV